MIFTFVYIDSCYLQDLVEHLNSETSGNLRELICALMIDAGIYDAKLLHDAMDVSKFTKSSYNLYIQHINNYTIIQGPGTDESLLLEVLCTRSNAVSNHKKDLQ